MDRLKADRFRLSLRDYVLLIPVAVASWIITFYIYKLSGSSAMESGWSASWVALIITLATGMSWIEGYFASKGGLRHFVLFGVLFVIAGLIAAGFQIYAGPRNLFEVLFEGRPKHAPWHQSSGIGWYAIYLLAGLVLFLSAARRCLWMAVDSKRDTLRNYPDAGAS